jgi:hypothetical protein
MKDELTDHQLIELISVCKMRRNYTKISVTLFTLINNLANRLGVYLGLKIREEYQKEALTFYFRRINRQSLQILGTNIISKRILQGIEDLEPKFHQNRGNLSLKEIESILEFYYDLRKIDLPTVLEAKKSQKPTEETITFFSGIKPQPQKKQILDSDVILDLLLKDKEEKIAHQLEQEFSPEIYGKKMEIESLRNQLNLKKSEQEKSQASLLFKNSILGVMIICLILGLLVLIEVIMNPFLAGVLGLLTFGLLGMGAISFLTYKHNGGRKK